MPFYLFNFENVSLFEKQIHKLNKCIAPNIVIQWSGLLLIHKMIGSLAKVARVPHTSGVEHFIDIPPQLVEQQLATNNATTLLTQFDNREVCD